MFFHSVVVACSLQALALRPALAYRIAVGGQEADLELSDVSDASHFQAVNSGAAFRLGPAHRTPAVLGAARHFVATLPHEDLRGIQEVPFYALLEQHGVSLDRAFGWFVLQEHAQAMASEQVEAGQAAAAVAASFMQITGADDDDDAVDEDEDSIPVSPDEHSDDIGLENEDEDEDEDEDDEATDQSKGVLDSVAPVEDVFRIFDKNGDGTISVDELRVVLRSLGHNPSEQQIQESFARVDTDNNGHLNLPEFVKMMDGMTDTSDAALRTAFEVFDKDHDGSVSPDELAFVLRSVGMEVNMEDMQEVVKRNDKDRDGRISIDEFVHSMDKEDMKKLHVAIMAIGAAFSFSQLDSELDKLERGEATSHTRMVLNWRKEALDANLLAAHTDIHRMNAILAEYLRLQDEAASLGDNAHGIMPGPLSEANPEAYRAWRKRERFKAPTWLKLLPEDDENIAEAARLFDRSFDLYMAINGWLTFVRAQESVTWDELQTKSLRTRLYEAVSAGAKPYVKMLKRGYNLMARLWVKFKSSVTNMMKKCASETQEQEKEVMEGEGVDKDFDSEESLEVKMDRAESGLRKLGEGSSHADEEITAAIQSAKEAGEDFAELQAGLQEENVDATAAAAEKSQELMEEAQDVACKSAWKVAAEKLREMIRKIREVADNALPDIGIRGLGGSATVFGGGIEEIVDFRNKEIGYFAGKGIVVGGTMAGATMTGYAGFGWKNSKANWTLDETYRAGLWVMGRASMAVPLPFASVIEGTASLGLGFKTDADDSAGIPWVAEKDGLKMVLFGVSMGVAATGMGRQGVSVQYGGDRYRFITSECFDDLDSFQQNIWKLWCGTCATAQVGAKAGEGKAKSTVGLSVFRSAVHLASFPGVTDLIFTYLAWRNDVRSGGHEKCSAFSVRNRNNASKLSIMASHYAAESSNQIELLKFHLKRMEENFDNLQTENGNLSDLTKAQDVFKRMQLASCRRFPFQGKLGAYLYKDEAADYPVKFTREDLESMEDAQLQSLCTNFTFSCKRKYTSMFGRSTSQKEIIDRLHEAIQRRAATSEYPMGSCTKDKQCPLQYSSCQQNALNADSLCTCQKGYCFRVSKSGELKCRKPKGKDRNRAINALSQWVSRTELRLGLLVSQLKKLN